ncbi:MAG: shikimate dehydrogenase [Chloroflexi bacterium RBG_16_51_9]|nr:MAG: shikimate dehydrogenase [Chloroflexi bacterium RBG_16_51_9]
MTNSISGKTRICGLIGDPVEHTMSPAMHNAAFKKLGLDYVYIVFRVKGTELDEAIAGMRALNMRGMNVTIPHKVAVMKLLDKLDPMAEKIGAVNTIVNDDGKLTGYNTDATGFLQPLLEKGIEPNGKSIVLVGAGGASRGISFVLAEGGANLVILNRNLEKAEHLARQVLKNTGKTVTVAELSAANLKKAIDKTDILVNATSVGMSPNSEETPVPARLLRRGLVVYDIVYNPVKTRLLREAEAAGAETISGIDMLVWQGALAFEKWTTLKAPVKLMKNEAMKLL